MTTDQIVPGAIAAVVLIFIVVGIVRVLMRRRGRNEDAFGAGGIATVPVGTRGIAKTDLAPSGVVRVVSEEWSARSSSGDAIAAGAAVRVVSQDGLTLVVDQEAARPTAQE